MKPACRIVSQSILMRKINASYKNLHLSHVHYIIITRNHLEGNCTGQEDTASPLYLRSIQLPTSATYWPIVPAPGDCEDGEFGGLKIGRGNRSTRRKPAPAPLCQPQIPLDQTRN
jgi:hypothetical protein